jgi:hypothetical protein
LHGHVHIRDVLVLRADRKGHVQVVALGLPDGSGFILADTARQVGDTVLLHGLDLDACVVDGREVGGV